MLEDIDQLSFQIHLDNVKAGWWDNPHECLYQKMQLISTEIAEATEGARKDLMDDHLPHRKMEEVELADTLIRVLDLGGKLNLTVAERRETHYYCHTLNTKGQQHLGLTECLIKLASIYDGDHSPAGLNRAYTDLITNILTVADNAGYCLQDAVSEKLAYNKQRADHKQENRNKEGGKKF